MLVTLKVTITSKWGTLNCFGGASMNCPGIWWFRLDCLQYQRGGSRVMDCESHELRHWRNTSLQVNGAFLIPQSHFYPNVHDTYFGYLWINFGGEGSIYHHNFITLIYLLLMPFFSSFAATYVLCRPLGRRRKRQQISFTWPAFEVGWMWWMWEVLKKTMEQNGFDGFDGWKQLGNCMIPPKF